MHQHIWTSVCFPHDIETGRQEECICLHLRALRNFFLTSSKEIKCSAWTKSPNTWVRDCAHFQGKKKKGGEGGIVFHQFSEALLTDHIWHTPCTDSHSTAYHLCYIRKSTFSQRDAERNQWRTADLSLQATSANQWFSMPVISLSREQPLGPFTVCVRDWSRHT